MKKWIFNPFTYIAGTRALLIGWAIMAVTIVIAFFSHAHFDGAMDAHYGAHATLLATFIESLTDWICLVLPLYILGRIASTSAVRFIDIAGTLALARWPLFFAAFLGFIPVPIINPDKLSPDQLLSVLATPGFIIQALLALVILVWYIALLYNAFAVSSNLKGGKSAAAFIAGLIIAEVLSKVILMKFYN